VHALVTQLGVMRREDGEFVLHGVHADDVDSGVREARERCGWDLHVARTVEKIDPPTRTELHTLRLMDPHGWFRR
jgi:acyl CoA:acetate/3-ketoacid CoA transferase beta subunit